MEEWRPIPGYEGRYDVSNLGRVRSLRFVNGFVDRPRPEPLIMSLGNVDGYRQVWLSGFGMNVHRAVLLAFKGMPPEGRPNAAHLDGSRDNNVPDNLVWASQSENCQHKLAHDTHQRGDRNGRSRVSDADARKIRDRVDNLSISITATKYGVSIVTVKRIRNGKRYIND